MGEIEIRVAQLTKPQLEQYMAWTTRVVKIDAETNEVLTNNTIREYEKIGYEKIYNKLTDTHNEIIIIQKYRKRAQQSINFGER